MSRNKSWTLKDVFVLLGSLAVIGGIIYFGSNSNLFQEKPEHSGGIVEYRAAHPEQFAHPVVDEDADQIARAQEQFKQQEGHYAYGSGRDVLARLKRVTPALSLSEQAEVQTLEIEEKDNGLGFRVHFEYDDVDPIDKCRITFTTVVPNSDWGRVCWDGGGERVLVGSKQTRDEVVAENPELK